MDNNELAVFEEKSLLFVQRLKILKTKKERLEKEEKDFKDIIEKLFDEYGLKSFKNDYFSITRVAESESKSIDLKDMEKKEPELYAELLEDYPKVTKKKGYIRISVK